ncbi:hypothetical protein TI05_10400 [Achromatium sp. WMS3]|nr:hypothetical protein TI05_10400 [Achromatium sp. WMS3]
MQKSLSHVINFIIWTMLPNIGMALTLTSPPLILATADIYTTKAQAAWQALPNALDPAYLDRFIAIYPQSAEAAVALTLRFNGVQTSSSIPEYHGFIALYGDTLAGEQALYEVFKLYQAQHTLAGYFDFLRRYPNAPQAPIAQMHIEALAFAIVTKLNQVAEYDAYIGSFPTAPQAKGAENLAKQLALQQQKTQLNLLLDPIAKQLEKKRKLRKYIETQYQQGEISDAEYWEFVALLDVSITDLMQSRSTFVEQHAAKLATRLEQLAERIERLQDEAKSNPTANKQQIAAKIATLGLQFKRHKFILRSEPFLATQAAGRVRKEERYKRLMQYLDQLQNTLITERERLIAVLREEFAATRKTLEAGFELLYKDNQIAQASLDQLVAKVAILHDDLNKVNANLQRIHTSLTDVHTLIQQGNAHLAVLHEDLDQVYGQIVQITKDVGAGSARQQALLKTVATTTKQGFGLLHQDMQQQQLATQQRHQQKISLASRQLYANRHVAAVLKENHQQRLTARRQQTEVLRGAIKSQGEAVVNAQRVTVQSIHHQTKVSMYNTQRILATDRMTQGMISQQTKQFEQLAKPPPKKSIWGSIVGIAANIVLPGAGMVVGPLINGVTKLAEGKNWKDALGGVAEGVVGKYCKECVPALNIARGIVDGKSPEDILLAQGKALLKEHCSECTPVLDAANQIAKGKDPMQVVKDIGREQLGKQCPTCGQVVDNVTKLRDGKSLGDMLQRAATQRVISACPQCAPAVDTLTKVAKGADPIKLVKQATQTALHNTCPECASALGNMLPAIQANRLLNAQARRKMLSQQLTMKNVNAGFAKMAQDHLQSFKQGAKTAVTTRLSSILDRVY